MEAQQIHRFRGVRVVPVLRPESTQYLVGELQREIRVDDKPAFLTAPYRIGAHFSILGLGQTESLLETSLLDVTDYLSHKALLETVYLQIGEQFMAVQVDVPLQKQGGTFRQIGLTDYALSVRLDSRSRDVEGKILNLFDPFTAAGIVFTLQAKIGLTVNLELADTVSYASKVVSEIKYPDLPSLEDQAIRDKIQQDLNERFAQLKLVGYDVDIDRLNLFRRERYVKPEVQQAAAVEQLRARYQEPPLYVPV